MNSHASLGSPQAVRQATAARRWKYPEAAREVPREAAGRRAARREAAPGSGPGSIRKWLGSENDLSMSFIDESRLTPVLSHPARHDMITATQ